MTAGPPHVPSGEPTVGHGSVTPQASRTDSAGFVSNLVPQPRRSMRSAAKYVTTPMAVNSTYRMANDEQRGGRRFGVGDGYGSPWCSDQAFHDCLARSVFTHWPGLVGCGRQPCTGSRTFAHL